MKRLFTACFFVLGIVAVRAQKVEELRRGMPLTGRHYIAPDLFLLDPSIDTGQVQFLATLKATLKNDKRWGTDALSAMYEKLMARATWRLKANVYRLSGFVLNDTAAVLSLTLDVYYASDSVLQRNALNWERSVLYVWPEPGRVQSRVENTVVFNGSKVTLHNRQYIRYTRAEGVKVVVCKGNTDYAIKGAAGQQPMFMAFHGCCAVRTSTFGTGYFIRDKPGYGQLLLLTYFTEAVTPSVHRP